VPGRLAYDDFPAHQMRLPGLVVDALPDGWGLLLMGRLAFINGRARGADLRALAEFCASAKRHAIRPATVKTLRAAIEANQRRMA
jgi:hypothetical protein